VAGIKIRRFKQRQSTGSETSALMKLLRNKAGAQEALSSPLQMAGWQGKRYDVSVILFFAFCTEY
jgi:hypothetical protein